MNLPGALLLSVLIVTVLLAPRRWALLGMMAGVLYLTEGQQLNFIGFNLFAIRLLELAGFIRVVSRKEFIVAGLNGIDRALLLLYSYTTVVFLLRSTEGQAYQIGMAVDAFLCYVTFRGLIGDVEEFQWFLRSFVVLLAPYVGLLLVERVTGHNCFAFMGGVNESDFERFVRDDKARCFGSFRHPALLGTLGASFLPLYIGLALVGQARFRALIAIGLCLAIVWASNSGGPLTAAACGLLGWMLWTLRTKMRIVRWTMVSSLLLLTVLMKAPVWYLLARVSSLTGGDGWHRSYLLDVAVRNIPNWWFAGMSVDRTSEWFPYTLRVSDAADITNQFIVFGIAAGLGAVSLFVVLLVRAFSMLGKAMVMIRSASPDSRRAQFLLWGLGSMLAVHVVNWFGISYFDQIYVIWFLQLAIISNVSGSSLEAVQLVPMANISIAAGAWHPYDNAEQPSVVSE